MSWFLQPHCGRLPYSYEESCVSNWGTLLSIKTGGCGENCLLAPIHGTLLLESLRIIREFVADHGDVTWFLLTIWGGYCSQSQSFKTAVKPTPMMKVESWCMKNQKEALGTWGRKNHTKRTDLSQVLSVWGGVCFFFGGCFVDYRWGCVWVIICHWRLLQNAAGRGFGCGATGQRSGFHTLLHGNSLARRWSEELLSAHFDHGQGASVTGWQSGVHGWTYINRWALHLPSNSPRCPRS